MNELLDISLSLERAASDVAHRVEPVGTMPMAAAPLPARKENTMDLCLPRDFFRPRRGVRLYRDDLGPALQPVAARATPRDAFVTGLRDWRHHAATPARHPAHVADNDWHPL